MGRTIIAVIFVAATSVTMYAQDTITVVNSENVENKILETDTATPCKAIDYETFKNLRDKQMLEFLKDNDAESYQMFLCGEMRQKPFLPLLISGIAFTYVGELLLLCRIAIPVGGLLYVLVTPNYYGNDFDAWWKPKAYWLTALGLSAVIIGQPLFIASIVVKKSGSALKQKAKNNYADKFYNGYTSSVNFNFYPNGLGISLKF